VSAMMRPSSISMRRCMRLATAWSWVTTTIVVPPAFSSAIRSSSAAPVAESRLPVGSSASTIAGSPASARAIATRWRSPPDNWVGRAASLWPSPTRRSAQAARSLRSGAGTPAYSSPSATLFSAFACSARKNCWNTNPMLAARSPASSRSPSLATSSPVTRTLPAEGRSNVPIRCSRVVFPDPDGPRTATSSPARTARLTPVSAVTGGALGYTFVT